MWEMVVAMAGHPTQILTEQVVALVGIQEMVDVEVMTIL
jgi:hypothetical protein